MEIDVTVEETLSRIVTVDADNEKEVILIAENIYDNEYVTLDKTDLELPAKFFIKKKKKDSK